RQDRRRARGGRPQPDPGHQRARRRGQLRRLPVPWPAGRAGPGDDPDPLQRRRRDRDLPPGVLDRDAHQRGDRSADRGRGPQSRPDRRSDVVGAAQPRRRRSGAGMSAITKTAASTSFVSTYEEVTRVRIEDPGRFARHAAARKRRTHHHTARGAVGVGSRAQAMASRTELLDRMREALAVPGVDGVLGTADILEDLLVLGALEDKVVFASMNRGGLQGSSWEIEDRFTAYDAASIHASGFDGGKMLTRIDLEDDRTPFILEASANAVTDLARHELIAMVEPFMSSRPGGPGTKVVNDLSPEAVIKSIHIAQGLGATSAYTWLKLPAVDDMERVMDATTMPTLILGGDPVDDD